MQDHVPLTVNHLTPSQSASDSQVHSVFSFDYYHPEFNFCEPEGGAENLPESLGSILFGDRIKTSPFILRMGINETCKSVCGKKMIPKEDAPFVNERIIQNYNINWLVDGLPAGQLLLDRNTDTKFYSPGFLLGNSEGDRPALNTHYDILVDFHQAGNNVYRVVGILVEPSSLGNTRDLGSGKAECGDPSTPLYLSNDKDTEFVYTYSVYWRPSSTSFATRWDKYLHVYDPKIHWFSLINSAVIVFFLVGMVSTILTRTLRKDIARYNRLDQLGLDDLGGGTSLDETVQEDSGWKLVHGDVFRPPRNALLLSVLIGNGAQLFMMAAFTIVFALFGFLSPSNRGALGSIMILLYSVFGFVSGYAAARVYKSFQGDKWKQLMVLTPVVVPASVFGAVFLMNIFVWARASSGAVPFGTMVVAVLIWFVITLPLSVGGSWLGFKRPMADDPVRTNQIPRQIPPAVGHLRPIPSMLIVGVLPFGAIFVELYFIMNSIWFSRIYYMFGFLFLCYSLMLVSSAAVTILMVYFLLCAEDYHWQWRAFVTSGASAIYVFAYALLYWIRTLSFSSWTSGVLYLGYSSLISALWFLLTGELSDVGSCADTC